MRQVLIVLALVSSLAFGQGKISRRSFLKGLVAATLVPRIAFAQDQGCELLVINNPASNWDQTFDPSDPSGNNISLLSNYTGAVVCIQPTGWGWTQLEQTNPNWAIIQVPDLSVEQAAALFFANQPPQGGAPITSVIDLTQVPTSSFGSAGNIKKGQINQTNIVQSDAATITAAVTPVPIPAATQPASPSNPAQPAKT